MVRLAYLPQTTGKGSGHAYGPAWCGWAGPPMG